jgi:hypothetical protein
LKIMRMLLICTAFIVAPWGAATLLAAVLVVSSPSDTEYFWGIVLWGGGIGQLLAIVIGVPAYGILVTPKRPLTFFIALVSGALICSFGIGLAWVFSVPYASLARVDFRETIVAIAALGGVGGVGGAIFYLVLQIESALTSRFGKQA